MTATLHCASAPQAGEQRETSVGLVLSAAVNEINSSACALLCLTDKYTTTKANKQYRWDKRCHEYRLGTVTQKEEFPNSETNNYCLGLYMRFFLTEQRMEILLLEIICY